MFKRKIAKCTPEEQALVPVPGLADTYASRGGEIYSMRRGTLKKFTARDNGRGYLRAMIHKKLRCIHRLVALTFLGPVPDGLEVNHKDGNKLNNCPENLEYVTRSQNVKHCFSTGLRTHNGERHPSHKLTNDQVIELRAVCDEMSVNGRISDGARSVLAKRYGIVPNYVTAIFKRKTRRVA